MIAIQRALSNWLQSRLPSSAMWCFYIQLKKPGRVIPNARIQLMLVSIRCVVTSIGRLVAINSRCSYKRINKFNNMSETAQSVPGIVPPSVEKEAPKQGKKSKDKPKKEKKEEEVKAPVIIFLKDLDSDKFGDYRLINSSFRSERKWSSLSDTNEANLGKRLLFRVRVHGSRVKGNVAFLKLRQNFVTAQAAAFKSQDTPKQFIKYMEGVPKESIVDIEAEVVKAEKTVESCSIKDFELQIKKFFVVNRAANQLPLQVDDASRRVTENEDEYLEEKEEEKKEEGKKDEGKKEEQKLVKVKLKTRLDNRVIDLRTPAKQAIFHVQSAVCQYFRTFLLSKGFMEIHTPKLIAGTSEGGANVFKLDYFGKQSCLAQSPQLYKQMSVLSDFTKVFEIAPVFRAENSFSHRHATEFIGLDIEMAIKEHYFEVLDVIGDMFSFIFRELEEKNGEQLRAINQQYQFEPFKYVYPVVKLTFAEGVQLLKEKGLQIDPFDDLNTEAEKKLGAIVREKFGTDFYILHRYPIKARPFYTMLCEDDPRYTCSYDIFMRGEEISSGAQRIHDPQFLSKRAEECGIRVETIKDYIDSFRYGAFPHGGAGLGLERIVMLYCALGNIRNTALFPRDPRRITP